MILGDQPCVLRQQVRGLYAISGGPWGDIGVSICCVCFSLAQLDKEIRAREGQDDLRTSRPFCRHKSHVELETRQPKLTQPMLYRPTMSFRPPIRRTSTYFAVGYPGRSRSDPTNLRSNDALLEPLTSEMQAPKKLTKKNKQDGVGQIYDFVSAGSTSNISPRDCAVAAPRDPVETFEPYHGALNKGLDFLVGRASRMRSESNAADKGIAEQISQRGLEKCGKREKPGDVESHSLTECDPMTNVLTETVEQNSECDTVVITSPGVEDEHSLMSCDPIAATPSESNGQHALKECTTTPIGFSIAAEQHELPECAIVAITPPTASEQYTFFNCKGEESTSPVAVDQHYLQECSKIPVTSPPAIKELVLTDYEDSSNGSEIQHPQPKLRYVHSRRDCSVDRNLLEYYEKEERKARQYTFGDCPRTFSVDSRFNNRSLQHPLTDCDINGNQIIRSTSTANTVPESYDSNEVGYAYDVSYLTQSLHDTQSSDVSVFAKSKSNGSESEPKPVIDSYFYDKSYLTDIRHSTEGIATLGSDENVTSSENDYRRRRLKRKADTSEVQEERKTIQGSATIDNGSSCATPSDAQVLLARILAAQKERNAKSRTWSRRRRLVDGCDEMPDSGEWFGQKLYVGKTRMRSCSSPFAF